MKVESAKTQKSVRKGYFIIFLFLYFTCSSLLHGQCVDPPVAGTTNASQTTVCSGASVNLSLSGNTSGAGQTYQWQESSDGVSFSNIPGETQSTATRTVNNTSWFRALVSCGSGSNTSAPVQVSASGTPLSGTYTLNKNAAASSTNFVSFQSLNQALSSPCGVDGPVVINVVPASGPYTEQVSFGEIVGSSASNTVTLNGNGETLEFSSSQNNRFILRFDGTDYFILDSLNIKSLSAEYGWGIHLMNEANHNVIRNCRLDMTSITGTTYAHSVGIVAVESTTNISASGNSANYNLFENNHIFGASSSGPSQGIVLMGTTSGSSTLGNILRNNTITDFHGYGVYLSSAPHTLIEGNIISRPNRDSHINNTLSGIHLRSVCKGVVVRNNEIFDLNGVGTSNTMYFIHNIAGGTSDDPMHFYNNIIHTAHSRGGTIYGLYNQAAWVNYYHNTVVLADTTPSSHSVRGFFTTVASNDNINIFNNIFHIGFQSTAVQYAVHIHFDGVTNVHSDHNVFFLENGAMPGYRGTAHNSLQDWRAATGNDLNGLAIDPNFTDPANAGYLPTNSMIMAMGRDLTSVVAEDIEGSARRSASTPGAFEIAPLPGVDPAISKFTSPETGACGESDVKVEVLNLGADTIDSITIEWSINGVSQGSQVFTQSLASGSAIELVLGQITINQGQQYDFSAEIIAVSPGPDINLSNNSDSLKDVRPALSGHYTINQNESLTATNFPSFMECRDRLAAVGVCGPVVITVVPGSGPYTEQLTFPEISGSSAINTITIKGNRERLQYNGSVMNRAVLRLNGTDHMIIDSLEIYTLNDVYGWGIHLLNQADSNIIRNCILDISSVTSTTNTNSVGITASGSNTNTSHPGNNANYNLIENNHIRGEIFGGAYEGISI